MMFMQTVVVPALVSAALAAPALAQTPLVQAYPMPNCSVSPAEREVNRQAAMAFYRPGITPQERLALLDPGYIQHNAVLKKAAQQQGISDYEAFRNAFAGQAGGPGPGPAGGAPAAGGPQPPAGNDREIVTAECDLVTMVRRLVRQDPTAPPGTWYETFGFDTFRVRNGKLVEHWDGAVINPPAPPPAPPLPVGIVGGNVGHVVANLARATSFYRDVLGLTVRSEGAAAYPWSGDASTRAAATATVPIPGTMWALDLVQPQRVSSTAFKPRLHESGALTLILYVPDVDAVLARARAAAVPIVTTGGGVAGVGANGATKASVLQAPDGEFIELLEQAPRAGEPVVPVFRGNLRFTVADVNQAARAYEGLLGVTFRGGPAPIGDRGVPLMLGNPGATFHLRTVQLPGSGMTFELLEVAGPPRTPARAERGVPGVSYLRIGLAPQRVSAAARPDAIEEAFVVVTPLQP